ncbi:MAG: hypothetical protein VXW15_15775, partial [Bdellovibrionota bacterium]|nr:hypothetical protein [Bdellovibrionota bacterium]
MRVIWHNFSNRETLIDRIQYTHTKRAGARKEVRFTYTNREDDRDKWFAGEKHAENKLIKNIEMNAIYGGRWVNVFRYKFNHERGVSTKRSRIKWIQFCGIDDSEKSELRGTRGEVCLPETSFTYSDGHKDGPFTGSTENWLSWGSGNPQDKEENMKFVADTNGDGLGDLVWILSGFAYHSDAWTRDNDDKLVDRVCTAISDGTKFKGPHCHSIMAYSERTESESYALSDLNGDGATDIVAFSKTHRLLDHHGVISLPGRPIDRSDLKNKRDFGMEDRWGGSDSWYRVTKYHGVYKKSDRIDNYSVKEREKCGRDGGLTYCNNYTKREIRDVNGDGLPDLVLFGMKNINVGLGQYKGDGREKTTFSDPKSWLGKAHHSGET